MARTVGGAKPGLPEEDVSVWATGWARRAGGAGISAVAIVLLAMLLLLGAPSGMTSMGRVILVLPLLLWLGLERLTLGGTTLPESSISIKPFVLIVKVACSPEQSSLFHQQKESYTVVAFESKGALTNPLPKPKTKKWCLARFNSGWLAGSFLPLLRVKKGVGKAQAAQSGWVDTSRCADFYATTTHVSQAFPCSVFSHGHPGSCYVKGIGTIPQIGRAHV